MTYHELIDDEHYINIASPPSKSYPRRRDHSAGSGPRRRRSGRAIAANANQRILFVSHGDIIRTVLCHFMRMEIRHYHRIRVDNATFSAIQIAGEFAEVKFMNLLPDPGRAFVAPFSTARTVPARPQPK